MKIIAISGSTRKNSTNTHLLRSLAAIAPKSIEIKIFEDLSNLPIFTIDIEPEEHPESVKDFAQLAKEADGIIFAVPEYVRTLPGGVKNAIDWLVPREEIIDKPIAIIHASWRGDDMLADLRRVLATVSINFNQNIFERFALANLSVEQIEDMFNTIENKQKLEKYLKAFADFIETIKATS